MAVEASLCASLTIGLVDREGRSCVALSFPLPRGTCFGLLPALTSGE